MQSSRSRREGVHGPIYERIAALFRRIQLVPFDVDNGNHSRTELNNIVVRRGHRVEYADFCEGSLENPQWTSIVYRESAITPPVWVSLTVNSKWLRIWSRLFDDQGKRSRMCSGESRAPDNTGILEEGKSFMWQDSSRAPLARA